MKKILSLSFIIIITLISFTGCAKKNSQDENNDSANNLAPLKSDAVISEGTWPSSNLISLIPEFTSGKVNSSVQLDNSASIEISDVSEENFILYVAKVQSSGFTENTSTESSENTILFTASNTSNVELKISYNRISKTMYISMYSK